MHRFFVQRSDGSFIIFEIRVGARIRVFLLEVDVALKLTHVLAKLLEFRIKVFVQLLAPDLLSAAVDNQSTQIFSAFRCFHIGLIPDILCDGFLIGSTCVVFLQPSEARLIKAVAAQLILIS